jgi:hypothetical protein
VQDGDDDEKDCALLHGCELHVVISFLATSSCPESFPPDAPTLWPRLGQALFGITAPSALRKSENFSGLPPPPRHIADCGGGVGGYYNAKFCRSRRARRAWQGSAKAEKDAMPRPLRGRYLGSDAPRTGTFLCVHQGRRLRPG